MCWPAHSTKTTESRLKEYGVKPGQKTNGNYQKHLNNVLRRLK